MHLILSIKAFHKASFILSRFVLYTKLSNIPDPCEIRAKALGSAVNVDFLLLQIEHPDHIIFLSFLVFTTFESIFFVSFLHDKQ